MVPPFLNMKYKYCLTIAFLFTFTLGIRADVEINADNFPDASFRSYIMQIFGISGRNPDRKVTDEQIGRITVISGLPTNTKSLEGIKYFTALETLLVFDTQVESLDVSGMKTLKLFNGGNELVNVNVSGCSALESMSLDNGQASRAQGKLKSVDAHGCTALKSLACLSSFLMGNLESLDVSGCTSLEELYCQGNQISSLDVSGCSALSILRCTSNKMTSLNVSGCTSLTTLACNGNKLTSLDVSGCTILTTLECYGNQIKGNDMDLFVNSLPTVVDKNVFYLKDLLNETDGNEVTESQIRAILDKGWVVSYRDKEGSWQQYTVGGDPETHSYSGITICGIAVTEENHQDVLGDGTVSISAGDDSYVLTLNNSNINCLDETFVRVSSGDLTVKLSGNNFVNTQGNGFLTENGNLIIIGDGDDAKLDMIGEGTHLYAFNELNEPARGDILIDNCSISLKSNKRHAIMGRYLTVQNAASLNIECGSGYAGCVFLFGVNYGEGIGMLTKNIELGDIHYFVDTTTGGYPYKVEIGPTQPGITEDTSVNIGSKAVVGSAVKVDGIVISLGEDDKIMSRTGSIILTSPLTTDQLTALLGETTPASETFYDTFKGVCFEKAAGKGSYEITFETSGDFQMTVKNGNKEPVSYTQSGRGSITIEYDELEPEWTFIYPTVISSSSRAVTRVDEGSLQLYRVKVTPTEIIETGIDKVQTTNQRRMNDQIYNLNGQRVTSVQKGIYIMNGRKVMAK